MSKNFHFLLLLMTGLTAIHPLTAQELPPAPAIFAAAFTDITVNGAQVVFTTSEPAKAQITVSLKAQAVKNLEEKEFSRIHRLKIDGLTAGQTYQVAISARNEAGATTQRTGLQLTPRAIQKRFDKFEGKTYFGVAHPSDLEPLQKLGAGMVRYSPTWYWLQPRPGEFDPKAVQKMVSYSP